MSMRFSGALTHRLWAVVLLGLTLAACQDDSFPDRGFDRDRDGVADTQDAFPLDPAEWADTDHDGGGDNSDPDIDNDGVLNAGDALPYNPTEWLDTDGDGLGNNLDLDDENDGWPDAVDAFPLDPTEWADADSDGIGNNSDPDNDNDGVPNALDVFPLDPNETLDADGDGTGNNGDAFPLNPDESADSDGDGIGDNSDAFPNDPTRSADANGDGIEDSTQTLTLTYAEPAGSNCSYGGSVTKTGLDGDEDGELQDDEIIDPENDVTYTCNPPTYSIGGTVSGLPADGSEKVVLASASGDSLSISANGSFTFPTHQLEGSDYAVKVSVQPASRFCEALPGSSPAGKVATANVSGVVVACHQHNEVTTWAGSGTQGGSDGTLAQAQFSYPTAVVVDAFGNLYVAESGGNRIRKISPDGVVSTFAGAATEGYVNATGTNARFKLPSGLAIDGSGNLYVADYGNHVIRKITPAGVVTTLAGSGTQGFVNGTGNAAQFSHPGDVAVDAAGNVYVTESSNGCLRKISPAGVVTTFAGDCNTLDFYGVTSIAVDGSGNVFVADYHNYVVRKIVPDPATGTAASVTTLAGSGYGPSADGVGTAATLGTLTGMRVDAGGNIFATDISNQTIRRIDPAGGVVTLAGTVAVVGGYVNAVGTAAKFFNPSAVTVDASGNLYVADGANQRIRKIYRVPTQVEGSIAGVPVEIEPLTPEGVQDAANGDATARFLLMLLHQAWDSTTYGPIPNDGTILDFALTMCQTKAGCDTPGEAMIHAVGLMQGDSTYFAIVAAWNDIRGTAGWGAPVGSTTGALPPPVCTGSLESGSISCTGGAAFGFTPVGGSRIPAELKQAIWQGATTPANLINTASLLNGMLTLLKPGDPGYGTALVTALKNLRNEGNALTRGLQTVLLLMEANRIAELQRQGVTLTAAQQTFAANLVSQMLTQEKAALAQVRADFNAYQEANRPPTTAGGMYYLGTVPTDAQKNALLTLIPPDSGSAAINDTATTTSRLLAAIGLSQQLQAGTFPTSSTVFDVEALKAGLGVGVPLAAAVTATSVAVSTSAISVTAAAATVGVEGGVIIGAASAGEVLGLSASSAGIISSAGSVAAAATGPAAIAVAAIVVVGIGADTVAKVNEYENAMNAFQGILELYTLTPPTLGYLTAKGPFSDARLFNRAIFGSDAQLLYAVVNVVAN